MLTACLNPLQPLGTPIGSDAIGQGAKGSAHEDIRVRTGLWAPVRRGFRNGSYEPSVGNGSIWVDGVSDLIDETKRTESAVMYRTGWKIAQLNSGCTFEKPDLISSGPRGGFEGNVTRLCASVKRRSLSP